MEKFDEEIKALEVSVNFLNKADKKAKESFLYYLAYRYMPDMILVPEEQKLAEWEDKK